MSSSGGSVGPILMMLGIGGTGTISIIDSIQNDAKFWGLAATVSGIAIGAVITFIHNRKTLKEQKRYNDERLEILRSGQATGG